MQQNIDDKHLLELASRWGYRGTVSFSEQNEHSAFLGAIHDRRLVSGLQVCTAQMFSLRSSTRMGTLSRSATLICSLAGSRLTYSLDSGQPFVLDPGMIAVISASDALSILTNAREGEQSRLLVIQAAGDTLVDNELAEEIGKRTRSTHLDILYASERTRALANRLFEGTLKGVSDRLVAESCALEILAQWLDRDDSFETPCLGRDRAKILRLCEYMQANLEKEHHLVQLAREAGMSLSSFKTKFQTVTGQTVFGFLAEKRLERARRGIENEGWTVSEAAWFTGYRHPTNFSSAFRRHFGFNPKSLKQH